MKEIILTCDSGIDPIKEENMIPATIIENNQKTYKDCIEINSHTILERAKNGSLFNTAAPILGDYNEKFSSILEKGNNIIHLSMSSGISEGSVNSANLIANELNDKYDNKVYVIDTHTGATGGTLIHEITKELISKGYDNSEIKNFLNNIKKQILTSFYVPDPKGFIRSGRDKSKLCTKDKALLIGVKTAVMAGIKFCVNFNSEGNLYTKGIYKSKRCNGMMKLTQSIINNDNKTNFDSRIIVVGTLKENYVSMDDIITYLEDLKYFDKIIRKDINGIVAAYGCDDLCGISLIKKYK